MRPSVATSQSAAAKADLHQIGEVADRVGLSLRTVRYYEEMGLLTPEMRTDGGFRLYSDEQVDRLALIKRMKPLGFTVQEMRELLDAREALRLLGEGDPKRSAAATRLSEFGRSAGERCAELREQLTHGEELAKQLSRESRRARASKRGS